MGAYLRDEDVPINILRIQRNLISTHTVLELWVIFSYCN